MIIILSHLIFFSFIIYFNGKIFLDFINNNLRIFNFFETLIFGIIITGFFGQILNFFIPLNNNLIFVNLILIIFVNFRKYKTFYFKVLKEDYLIKFLLLIFISILIYGSEFSDDLNHYHGGYIINTDNLNYIFGLNFLHNHYGYSSIWLILHSYLNFNEYLLQDIHILNGILFVSILGLLINEILINIKNKRAVYFNSILIFFLFFIILKYTRLKEFGIDRPGFLIVIFFFYYYFKFYLVDNVKYLNKHYDLVLISFFLFSIKVIFLPFLIMSITLFIYNLIKNNHLKIFQSKFNIVLLVLGISYILKNILISGCIIYPIDIFCFNKIPWSSSTLIQDLTINTESMNKSFRNYSGDLTPPLYIQNFNWVETWFKRNFIELFEFLLTTLICAFFTIYSTFKAKIETNNIRKFIYFLSTIFILTIFITLKTPVIRMFHHLFLIFGIFIILFHFRKKQIYVKKNIFYSFLILIICFSLSKNIKRIYEKDFVNNPKMLIKDIGWYETPKLKKLESFNYYNGWNDKFPIGNEDLSEYNYTKLFIFNIISK